MAETLDRPATVHVRSQIPSTEATPHPPEPLNPLTALGGGALATSLLAACGGGGGEATPVAGSPVAVAPTPSPGPSPTPAPPPATPAPPSTQSLSEEQAARFLLQAQFSATDADIAALRSKGYAAWLTEQFAVPAGETGFDWLTRRGYADTSASTQFFNAQNPTDPMMWNQLFTAPDPVRKRVALALSELMVVGASSLNQFWRSHMAAAYWDLLSANALGNFRELLQAVTLSPAMGVFLNTRGNQKEDTATGRQPDENYAREVMQLFTIGLYQLNNDGTEKKDAAGNRLDSYTAEDVSNLARVFTGYEFDASQNVPTVVTNSSGETSTIPSTTYTRLPMVLVANRHSNLAATFLGTTIPANTPGATALRTALDTLANHPNVGPFIGKQLIQRLVTSNPSPAYVSRVATAFNNNGSGVRGDMKAVVSAVLLDDEARSSTGLAQPGFGKLREPMVRFVQWGRTFGLNSAANSWKIGDLSNPATQLGQSPMRAPSVFNFFRPGYVPPSTSLATAKQVAPEFQIVTESSVGGYLNYMQNAIRNGILVNAPNVPQNVAGASPVYDITANYANVLPLVADAPALVRKLVLLLSAGQVSAATQTTIANALNATPVTDASSAGVKLDRIAAAVFLVMASPEYLVQK